MHLHSMYQFFRKFFFFFFFFFGGGGGDPQDGGTEMLYYISLAHIGATLPYKKVSKCSQI